MMALITMSSGLILSAIAIAIATTKSQAQFLCIRRREEMRPSLLSTPSFDLPPSLPRDWSRPTSILRVTVSIIQVSVMTATRSWTIHSSSLNCVPGGRTATHTPPPPSPSVSPKNSVVSSRPEISTLLFARCSWKTRGTHRSCFRASRHGTSGSACRLLSIYSATTANGIKQLFLFSCEIVACQRRHRRQNRQRQRI